MRKIAMILGLAFLAACSGNHERSDAYGNFEADEVIVSSESQGKLIQLNLQEGSKLERGVRVGIVDTVALSIQKEQLLAQKGAVFSKIQNIKSQVAIQLEQKDVLLVEKDRIEKLFASEVATDQQMDDINGKLKVLERQIESVNTQVASTNHELKVIDKQIDLIEHRIEKSFIINPINGVVLEKYAEESEIIIPGKSIYKIADLSVLDLRVFISGDQLPNVKLGQMVQVLIDKNATENTILKGEVIWISEKAEFTPKIIQTKEERVNMVYAMKVRVKNDGRLKIGMPGEVNLINN